MLSNKTCSAVRTAINALQHYKVLNTLTNDCFDKALETEQQLSNEQKNNSPLYGRPILIKDNYCLQDTYTTCASKMLANFRAPYTSTIVQRLIDSGCIIVGKTNMDEFSMGVASWGVFGPVGNPWSVKKATNIDEQNSKKLLHVAGGSSGGSAAAVAANFVSIALGSDTGGSVRNPAARCGCYGFKPSYGLLSRYGMIALVNSFDSPGIFTRSIDDLILTINAIAGPDGEDATLLSKPFEQFQTSTELLKEKKKITIGLPDEYDINKLSSEYRSCLQHLVSQLTETGEFTFKRVQLPYTPYSNAAYTILSSCEIASNMSRYDGIKYGHHTNNIDENKDTYEDILRKTRDESLSERVRGRILAGNYYLLEENYEKYFVQSQRVRRGVTNDYTKVFEEDKVDCLLAPVVSDDPITHAEYEQSDTIFTDDDIFTVGANLAGLPALSFPVQVSSKGFPIGLQLIGPFLQDQALLSIANRICSTYKFPFLDLTKQD
ncbi:unnamed protein product [Rotaria magnacalcarata]|uniref:Glutamyl-tRNA(Gln) amidotransferase subunit A, mitochondrial n=3 Tax=Rotaria magnacalcarata TaxID=392030 RepID=A0A816VU87_9BILA|nr:unnamed protein product [Rotaria magnacalcarata]CAF2126962.1 unnamed protein product [Rotaria magnacalcarata]CAF3934060.1 unnamed protein product [Rotaria magnacalcarata]